MEAQLTGQIGEADLAETYKQIFPSVAAAVKKYGAGLEDAKDVFHDALLIWLELPEKTRSGIDNKTAYLVTIARNEWFRRVEKMEKLRGSEVFPEDEVSRISNTLYNYMVMAGKKCMDLLQAFYYEKRPASEIAGRFGFSGAHTSSPPK